MRWLKILGLILVGFVLGGGATGYFAFRYGMESAFRFNNWLDLNFHLEHVENAASDLGVLKNLADGSTEKVRNALEWRLDDGIAYLDLRCRSGEDDDGHARKVLGMIHAYREEHPWSMHNAEGDQLISKTLDRYPVPAKR